MTGVGFASAGFSIGNRDTTCAWSSLGAKALATAAFFKTSSRFSTACTFGKAARSCSLASFQVARSEAIQSTMAFQAAGIRLKRSRF